MSNPKPPTPTRAETPPLTPREAATQRKRERREALWRVIRAVVREAEATPES